MHRVGEALMIVGGVLYLIPGIVILFSIVQTIASGNTAGVIAAVLGFLWLTYLAPVALVLGIVGWYLARHHASKGALALSVIGPTTIIASVVILLLLGGAGTFLLLSMIWWAWVPAFITFGLGIYSLAVSPPSKPVMPQMRSRPISATIESLTPQFRILRMDKNSFASVDSVEPHRKRVLRRI